MSERLTDFERGKALGRFLKLIVNGHLDVVPVNAKADRAEGGNYDVRWDFADEAKAGTFTEFKRGFDAGFEEEDDHVED